VADVEELFLALGCEPTRLAPDEHDQEMALTHALAFFVAKGMLDVGVPEEPEHAPPSFLGMARSIEAVRVDAGHLLPALHRYNPYAAKARQRLLQALGAIDAALDKPAAKEPSGPTPVALSIPDLGALSPELKETRELIDEVDQELMALLARRAVLSERAGRTKVALGVGVQDVNREASLLEARRLWAKERGLDPEAVEEIFLAVLRFSRSVQR
jgi:prephenate dehydrogenase